MLLHFFSVDEAFFVCFYQTIVCTFPHDYYGIETFVDKSLSSFGAPTGVTFSPSEYAGVVCRALSARASARNQH